MIQNLKKDYIWNALGTITFSLVSIGLGIVVIRMRGAVEGGIFTFGYTTFSQLILTVTLFGVKTKQAIDVNRRFAFKEYKWHRFVTVVISLILGVIYLWLLYSSGTYDFSKSVIIFILMFHGIIEGYFDVYEAEYQRQHMLYKAGMYLFIRSIGWASVFILALFITKNLLISTFIGMASKFALGYVCEVLDSRKTFLNEKDRKVDIKKSLKDITIFVLPLFAIVFLDNFAYTANKFAIDYYMGDVYSGFYGFLFLPANAIYLLQYLVSRPLLTPLSELYNDNIVAYKKRTGKIILCALIVCVCIFVLGVALSGVYLQIVSIVTNNIYVSLYEEAKIVLFFIIMGGVFYAFYAVVYYMLIIENHQKGTLVVYVIVSVIALIIGTILTGYFGIVGAALSFAIVMFVLMAILVGMHLLTLKWRVNELSKR